MPDTNSDLGGRTLIVRGAPRGMGEALARHFAEAGGDVVMVDVDEQELEQAADTIGARAVTASVADAAGVERVVAHALEENGRIDVLVNNAGILRDRVLWKLTDDDWDAVLGVHLGGTFRCTRACVPHFRERGYGRVANVTSYTGLHGNVGQAAYAAAKAGIIGFTKTAANELARFGVTVNAVSPNAATRMVESIPDAQRAAVEAITPLGRFAEPDEIAAGVMFLASDDASYMTGTVVPIDGGLSM